MIRRVVIFSMLWLALVSVGFTQLSSKLQLFGGFTYNFVTQRLSNPVSDPIYHYSYGFHLGGHYTLAHSNDVASIGVNPNLNAAFSFSSGRGVDMLFQAPVFLVARVGASSTPFSESKIGVGAGAGLNFTFMRILNAYSFGGTVYDLKQSVVNPSVLGELNVRGRSSDYSIRAYWSVFRPSYDIDGTEFNFGVTTVGVVYNF